MLLTETGLEAGSITLGLLTKMPFLVAGLGIVDIIGLVGTGLTTIGFAQSNFAVREPQGATVMIKGASVQICSYSMTFANLTIAAGLPELNAGADSLVSLEPHFQHRAAPSTVSTRLTLVMATPAKPKVATSTPAESTKEPSTNPPPV
jgi:hypothetical protein